MILTSKSDQRVITVFMYALISATSQLVTVDALADGVLPNYFPNASLINEGRTLFFNETFDGNGRTCGSCHPEDNNFTLDPTYISTLDEDDPLFIAEKDMPNPLSLNFEKPELMRKVGLILENTNGFGDLEHRFTMRSVPHLRALSTTITAPSAAANDGTTTPPDERTGWGGDGSPVDGAIGLRGTIRDFSVGAVMQHFTKTLNREPGIDFRLPTEHELNALAAFMFSLGRQQEFDDLTQISMVDDRAEAGRKNYLGQNLSGGTPCNACHFNAGANTNPAFDFPAALTPPTFELSNRSFAPRGEELLDQHGDIVDLRNNPHDDGFGHASNLFNVPSVVEAADTGPFFHGNAIDTVEGMVAFYAAQRHLRNGEVLPAIVGLNGSQVVNVAAFVRVINADENIRLATVLVENAKQLSRKNQAINLHLAITEIDDAMEVLNGGRLHFADVVPALKKAKRKIRHGRLMKAERILSHMRGKLIRR